MSKPQQPTHCELPYFPVVDKQLQIGGQPVEQLAQRLGSTPFYAYDRAVIDQRIRALRTLLADSIRLHYAVKANPMPDLLRHVAQQVDGLDIASQGELALALQTGIDPQHISFTGPGKSEAELLAAINADITLNIESAAEMRRIARLASGSGIRPRVTVRINPDFELKSSGMRMGGGATPFGIDAEQVPALLKELADLDLEFWGFHIFAGSQNLRADAIIEAQNATLALAIQLAEHASSPVRLLNMGGGFGIPYFPGEQPLDIKSIGENLTRLVEQAKTVLPDAELALELGRYLVGEAGVYVCRVLDKKVSRGQTFLVTDGGLHQHLAASGNFGQVIRKNYPVVIGNKMGEEKTEKVNVVGRLCTPLDLLASKMELPVAEVGDLVVILQSGAYGLTASPTAFLGHPAPTEILL
ncbi:MAG: pyridoxal-dependent decarboxylase, exosortase A system-associated [Gammaproteobacteria bacterium]|nr:pyridoxal-dependent decarboxylase, exosortase A system-associated [Gammaproteobacteria bacterium]MCF6259869.1 pyridoxal-dependent decarboxylase, exosortase A system-associated [Gammaproteobacteria bacterium]